MVTELLDLARIEARAGLDFMLREQALAPLIEQACAAVAVPQESHTLLVELPDPALRADYDADKMRQALENVLSNAIKYSPAGGEVRVSVVHGPAGQEPALLGIAVQDQGMGMTPEQCEHAFERFYRADASGNIPGTGLGLSLVKEIVELHGGTVELHSRPGEGSTITLWLKAAAPHASATA
jgi:signal transduction histidine kinase